MLKIQRKEAVSFVYSPKATTPAFISEPSWYSPKPELISWFCVIPKTLKADKLSDNPISGMIEYISNTSLELDAGSMLDDLEMEKATVKESLPIDVTLGLLAVQCRRAS